MVAHVLKQRFVFFVLDDHALKEGARIYKRGAAFLEFKIDDFRCFWSCRLQIFDGLKEFQILAIVQTHISLFAQFFRRFFFHLPPELSKMIRLQIEPRSQCCSKSPEFLSLDCGSSNASTA